MRFGAFTAAEGPDRKLDPRTQREPNDLRGLYVRSDNGRVVPLDSVASLRQTVGPLSVNHSGQLPAATVSFNVKPGNSLSQAVAEAEAAARRTLPAGVTAAFQGSAEAFQSSLTGLGGLLLISVFVIYLARQLACTALRGHSLALNPK